MQLPAGAAGRLWSPKRPGYAGLHVALRLTAKLRSRPAVEVTLVDRHDYHQAITRKLPRVARATALACRRRGHASRSRTCWPSGSGLRAGRDHSSFDLMHAFQAGSSPGPGRSAGGGWCSRSAGQAQRLRHPGPGPRRTLSVYPADDAERVWEAVSQALTAAAAAGGTPSSSAAWRPWWSAAAALRESSWPLEASWLLEILPKLLPAATAAWRLTSLPMRLIEAGPTILAGLLTAADRQGRQDPCRPGGPGDPHLIAGEVAAATEEGFRLTDGQLVEGGVFVWAGGVKAPELVADSELPTGHNGRVKVDRYLRVLGPPRDLRRFGDLAPSVTNPRTGQRAAPAGRRWRWKRARRSPATWTRS